MACFRAARVQAKISRRMRLALNSPALTASSTVVIPAPAMWVS